MPYGFNTDRPDEDCPYRRAEDPIRWVNWAMTNAPFTSITTTSWAAVLTDQGTLLPPNLYRVLTHGGTLTREQTARVLNRTTNLPDHIRAVLSWAVDHGHGVVVTITGNSVRQHLAKHPIT